MEDRPNRPHQKTKPGRGGKAAKKAAKSKKKTDNKIQALKLEQKKKANYDKKIRDIKAVHARMPSAKNIQLNEAPKVVVVFGPPKTGKSVLIRSLIRNYTKQRINKIEGPITIVTAKNNRVTFIECNRDINNMLDSSKIADSVIFVIDACSGFELEHQEMATLCQTHGKPQIFSVVTHLDLLKSRSAANKAKSEIRKKIRAETNESSTMYRVESVMNDGKEYPLKYISLLAHSLSILKSASRPWRDSNPFIIVDRIKFPDSSESKNSKRYTEFYGYVRSSFLHKNQQFFAPGIGYFKAENIEVLNDPCPLSSSEKKRGLLDKELHIHAPMINFNHKEIFTTKYDNNNNVIENSEKKPIKLLEGLEINTDEENQSELSEFEGNDLNNINMKHISSQFESKLPELITENSKAIMGQIYDTNDPINIDNKMNKKIDIDEIINPSKDLFSIVGNQFFGKSAMELASDEDSEILEDSEFLNESKNTEESENDTKSEDSINFEAKGKSSVDEASEIESEYETDKVSEYDTKSEDSINFEAKGKSSVDEASEIESEYESNEGSEHGTKSEDSINFEAKARSSVDEASEIESEYESDEGSEHGKESNRNEDFKKSDNTELSIQIETDEESENYSQSNTNIAAKKFVKESLNQCNIEKDDYSTDSSENTELSNTMDESEEIEQNMIEPELEDVKNQVKNSEINHQKKSKSKYISKLIEKAETQEQIDENFIKASFDQFSSNKLGFMVNSYVKITIKNFPLKFRENFNMDNVLIFAGMSPEQIKISSLKCSFDLHLQQRKPLRSNIPSLISIGWHRIHAAGMFCSQAPNLSLRYLKYTPKIVRCFMAFPGPIYVQKTGMCIYTSNQN
ncbi:MAG: Glycoside hydrolase 2 (Mannanase, beta-galactosidase), partial [Paramarteilia canceri]